MLVMMSILILTPQSLLVIEAAVCKTSYAFPLAHPQKLGGFQASSDSKSPSFGGWGPIAASFTLRLFQLNHALH